MSISPTTISRQNSINHEMSSELIVQQDVLPRSSSDSSRSTLDTSIIIENESILPPSQVEDKKESSILNVVKRSFKKFFSFFGLIKNKEKSNEVQVNKLHETPDVAIQEPPELVSENSQENNDTDSESVVAEKRLDEQNPGSLEVVDENTQENTPEDTTLVSKDSENAVIEDNQVSFASSKLSQAESEESDLESSETSSVELSSSDESTSTTGEEESLTEGQEIILEDLSSEVKNFFKEHAQEKEVNIILRKAERHYQSILNLNLRRYSLLDADDKRTLALEKSRTFLEQKYLQIHSK